MPPLPPRVLIVVAPFYRAIADGLLAGARARLDAAGAVVTVIEVPGALEIPAAVRMGLDSGQFDGFLALGCVIRGETTHYETVCNESARGLMQLSIDWCAAVGNGILTCENRAQAEERADPARKDKGGEAAAACLQMIMTRNQFVLRRERYDPPEGSIKIAAADTAADTAADEARVMTEVDATAAPDPRFEKRLRRSAARLAAVQALYQMDITGASWRSVAREFEAHRLGQEIDGVAYRTADQALFRAVVRGVVEKQAEIDPAVNAALKETWPLGRIDPILRALFRAACYELIDQPKTPPVVAITEYVDVAKAFFDGKEPRFANAVLDALARKFRAADMPARE